MSNGDHYTPIDCGLYSNFELAILRGWRLQVTWQDNSGLDHIELLRPRDLQTRDHAEYLIAERGDGERIEIRLDRIREAQRREEGN
ncbi:transcriptional antiterminator [Thiohalobacter thiocyanaticus]|uniref:Transcriptional antiterminator n=1 Tax=Thiohalobacter thiocyanaticus TaxID=585455 RepID=A0A1Z4VMK4_9GAMM|nr:transcriptional antiterminator, Rof [Thiohalobacter thiocyanaticus]BAZ92464.1 transcriptional antiterminator [Thiohalobacter thiocyanaticus]